MGRSAHVSPATGTRNPESSLQVRPQGKTPRRSWDRCPVRRRPRGLSDHATTFRLHGRESAPSCRRVTWPMDPKPKDSFSYAERERSGATGWRCIRHERSQGSAWRVIRFVSTSRKTHVVHSPGAIFFLLLLSTRAWQGVVSCVAYRQAPCGARYFNDRERASVERAEPFKVEFEHFLLIERDRWEVGYCIEERSRRICDLLREHGRVTVDDLCQAFDLPSLPTARLAAPGSSPAP